MMLKPQAIRDLLVICFSFILGFILTILPLPNWAVWYRPAWVMMILIFWLMTIPHRVGVAVAWFIGLYMDLLTGTTLGLHALFFTVLAYLILKFHLSLRGMSSGQKAILVATIELIYLSMHYWVASYNNLSFSLWLYWMPTLTTLFCWPWVSLLLKDYQRRFDVT